MKKLITIVAIAAICVTEAAGYDSETLTLATNNVAAASAAFEYAKIPCGGQKDVAVHIEFSMDGAGTAAQTFVFGRSVTGSTNDIETLGAARTVVGIAATGNTRSVTVTNIPTYGAGFIYLIYSTNATAAAGVTRTNTIIKYGEKTMAP